MLAAEEVINTFGMHWCSLHITWKHFICIIWMMRQKYGSDIKSLRRRFDWTSFTRATASIFQLRDDLFFVVVVVLCSCSWRSCTIDIIHVDSRLTHSSSLTRVSECVVDETTNKKSINFHKFRLMTRYAQTHSLIYQTVCEAFDTVNVEYQYAP